MNLDRVLAVGGLVLSLPGFFLLFLTEQETVGALALLLGLVLFGAAWAVWYFTNLPPFTMVSCDVRLEFLDERAKVARLTKSYEIRPNYPHLTTLTHRNIAADGVIENIRWCDTPVRTEQIERVLGEYHVTIRWPTPLARRKVVTGKLSYDAVDSFVTGRQEALFYVADFPTKIVWVTIQMPPGQRCTSVKVTKIQGAGEIPVSGAMISNTGSTIELTLKRPPVGTEYAIYWDW